MHTYSDGELQAPVQAHQEHIKIGLEKFDDVIEELEPLLQAQLEETEPKYVEDGIELKPDYEIYRALEKTGKLYIGVVRFKGQIAGYFVLMNQFHLHHKQEDISIVDIMYVRPEYRHGVVTRLLMDFLVGVFKLIGSRWLRIGMKQHKKFETLLQSYGFNLDEVVYKLER